VSKFDKLTEAYLEVVNEGVFNDHKQQEPKYIINIPTREGAERTIGIIEDSGLVKLGVKRGWWTILGNADHDGMIELELTN